MDGRRWGNAPREPNHIHVWVPKVVYLPNLDGNGIKVIYYKRCQSCWRVLL